MSQTAQGTQKDVLKKKTVKEPDFYIYRLKKQNPRLTPNTPPYSPSTTIPNTSIIAYDPEKDEFTEEKNKPSKGALKICYLQGVDTIFARDQKDIPRS